MARCNCGGGSVPVVFQEGTRILIEGSGTPNDPIVISSETLLEVSPAASPINLLLSGDGDEGSPWVLYADFDTSATLGDIPDVYVPAPTNGQVLAWDGTNSRWHAQAPTTAASGSVSNDDSLNGDGSVGSPLAVNIDPDYGLATRTSGLGLSLDYVNRLNRRWPDAAARALAVVANPPTLNTLSMLESEPGYIWYWDGGSWQIVKTNINHLVVAPLLELSGPYVGTPVTKYIKQLTTTTGPDGTFEALTSTELEDYGGVISCHIQETGSVPYRAILTTIITGIGGVAYRLDTGEVLTDQPITATVIAELY